MESEDDDIYNDLPANCAAKYEEENKTLKEKIKVLVKKLQASEREKHNLNEKNAQLQRNISSLFKTACTEVNRKKRTIDDLRTQLENSVFRRSKQFKIDSPIHRNSDFSVSDKEQHNFADHCANIMEEGYETEPLDRPKFVRNDPVTASAEVKQEAAIPTSHITTTAVCTAVKQSCSLKRQVQHAKAPITLFSQRLLERTRASQKKDNLSPENNPDRLRSISDVDSNQAMSPNHVNLSKIAEAEYVSTAKVKQESNAEVKCPTTAVKCESTIELEHEAVLPTQANMSESAEVKRVFTAEVKRSAAGVKRECTVLVKRESVAEVECGTVLPSQLNVPESTEVKCEAELYSCVDMPESVVEEYESNAEVKPEPTLVEKNFVSDCGDLSEAMQKTEKFFKNAVNKFDLDSMEVAKLEESSISQVRTVQKFESQIKIELNDTMVDKESVPISDFRRRRRAKVISVSAGNKIIFDAPVSSSSERNDKHGVNHNEMGNILGSSRTENTSLQSSNDTSSLRRQTLPLKKSNSNENKFFGSSKTCDAQCKNIICQISDDDNSGDNCRFKCKSVVQESTRTFEGLRGRCAGISIDQFEGPSALKNVPTKTVDKKNDNGNTSKVNLTIQERLKAIAENSSMYSVAPTDKEATLANTNSESLKDSKFVTHIRRRRKPVSLGDSSFVVSGTS